MHFGPPLIMLHALITLPVVNTKSVIYDKSQKVASQFEMRHILFEKAFRGHHMRWFISFMLHTAAPYTVCS